MMSADDDGVTILSERECWDLLKSVPLGRLITSVNDRPDVFPVNFVVQRKSVLFRTAQGAKLVSAAMNKNVVFEADDHNASEAWSVIIRGRARSLRSDEEIEDAESAHLQSWTDSEKPHYVRILPDLVTGRRFQLGASQRGQSVPT
ncbi:pyridoxamine 5'-phosphate oxidase [Mycobacterium bourgelatii]|uniref:Pyridoxamine 5'-phosphate oxidase n=2 Tax=Mycobacterium bourgelatii TaxID=1273442 RepID=A0A7I9YS28_MYCBU|nr:pyridoxamine 5'-phosphate oxidase [Mycobacterium bourgelatii]